LKFLLETSGIKCGYGDTEILHGVSININSDEIVTIIGPNGSGKSTLLKSIINLIEINEGTVFFDSIDITNKSSEAIVELGICYVPQSNNVFSSLSVQENLEMGAFIRKSDYKERVEELFNIFPDLEEHKTKKARYLSGGQQQMLAIARALMLNPKLLLLDEPSAGLSPKFISSVFQTINDIRDQGVSILLVEQNAKMALSISDRAYVLATGEKRFEDTAKNLLNNSDISKLYLGG
jgi:branched-chain amino acid transport system ATP-binding protein